MKLRVDPGVRGYSVHPWNKLVLVEKDGTEEHVGFVFPHAATDVQEVLDGEE